MTQAERVALAQELYAKAGFGPGNPLTLSNATTAAEVNISRAQGAALMWKKVLGGGGRGKLDGAEGLARPFLYRQLDDLC